ncbi:MAG: hypothetical protein QNK37_18140 [Acidobacteriota bacterium]|nr:hypothetical protein [Acidobacteriota bacterium]
MKNQRVLLFGAAIFVVIHSPFFCQAGAHGGCIGTLANKASQMMLYNLHEPDGNGILLEGEFDMVVSSHPTSWNLEENNYFVNYHWLSTGENGRPPEESFMMLMGVFRHTREDGTVVELQASFSLEKEIVYSDHPPEQVQSGATLRPTNESQPTVEPVWGPTWFPAIQTHQLYFTVIINDLQLLDPRFPETIELVNRTPLKMQGIVEGWDFDPNEDHKKEGPIVGTTYSQLENVDVYMANGPFTGAKPMATILTSDITVMGKFFEQPK